MGRECYRVNGHGGDGDVRGRVSKTISSFKSKRKPNGCMAVFHHLFDFQHFYFPSHHHHHHHHHHHLTIDSLSRSKGLKLVEESLPSTTYKAKQRLNIPANTRVRTETGTISSRLRVLATDTSTSSSEICNSPGTKTPNLVARLMGLDLLPDQTYLNHSLSNLHTTSYHGSSRHTSHRLFKNSTRLGTRSLPGSPRISSARKSDFDIHRLSLQLNKENNKHEELGCSRLIHNQEENRSPRDYARQIVKQIKERVVTRRVLGMDITNRDTVPSQELRRDTTVSCSPRTRFSDKENKPKTSHKPNSSSSFRPEHITEKPKTTTMILVPVSKATKEKQSQKRVKQRQLKPINKCNKAESETRFTQRPIKPSSPAPDTRIKQREAFLSESRDVKAKPLQKKIPIQNHLEKFSTTRISQNKVNERDRLKSSEDASIFFILMHKTEKDSSHVPRSDKLNNAATDSEVTRLRSSIRCPVPEEIVSMDVNHLFGTKKKLEEEGEEIIGEIEREIIDALVREAVSLLSLNQILRRKTKSDEKLSH